MANGINANLLRRWVSEVEMRPSVDDDRTQAAVTASRPTTEPSFVPVSLPSPATPAPSPEIRIELHRGATAITVTWPTSAASECEAWMRGTVERVQHAKPGHRPISGPVGRIRLRGLREVLGSEARIPVQTGGIGHRVPIDR